MFFASSPQGKKINFYQKFMYFSLIKSCKIPISTNINDYFFYFRLKELKDIDLQL